MLTVAELNARLENRLAGQLGVELVEVSADRARSRLTVRDDLLNTMGSLHAASVVALADTTCGAGALCNLPPDARGFVTLELKTNFVGAVRSGSVRCLAKLLHAGRSTQLWEAVVENETDARAIAFFSCTELLLYENSAGG
jgi:uncharacterized protein (TIGR00369 family)